MSEAIAAIEGTPPIDSEPENPADSKRLRWFEVSLVLLVTCSGYVLNSIDLLIRGRNALPTLPGYRWTSGIIHETIGLLLLGYILSRRRMRIADLGLSWSLHSIVAGLGVAFVSYVVYGMGGTLVHDIHNWLFPNVPNGLSARDMFTHPSIAAVPFMLLNPFFEEMIVRAYLMTEIKYLTGSWVWAAAVSVVVQTTYHLYYGWEGALSLAFQFLVFAIYYARTRRATPLVVAHGIFDIWGLIRLW